MLHDVLPPRQDSDVEEEDQNWDGESGISELGQGVRKIRTALTSQVRVSQYSGSGRPELGW